MLFLLLALAAAFSIAAVSFAMPSLSPKRTIVYGRIRLEGVRPELLAHLDAWEREGSFPLMVGQDGGVRTDEAVQHQLYVDGRSKARTLAETPHGHAAAFDVYPFDEAANRVVKDETDNRWFAMAAFFKQRGLVWGGDFTSIHDMPHFELPEWRSLPMPSSPGVV